jgi:hypothetical protein
MKLFVFTANSEDCNVATHCCNLCRCRTFIYSPAKYLCEITGVIIRPSYSSADRSLASNCGAMDSIMWDYLWMKDARNNVFKFFCFCPCELLPHQCLELTCPLLRDVYNSPDQAVYCLILSCICGIYLWHSTWMQSKEFTFKFLFILRILRISHELLENTEKNPATDTEVTNMHFFRWRRMTHALGNESW